jgi:hypothetical protein
MLAMIAQALSYLASNDHPHSSSAFLTPVPRILFRRRAAKHLGGFGQRGNTRALYGAVIAHSRLLLRISRGAAAQELPTHPKTLSVVCGLHHSQVPPSSPVDRSNPAAWSNHGRNRRPVRRPHTCESQPFHANASLSLRSTESATRNKNEFSYHITL